MNKKWKFHKLTDISKPKQWQNLPVSALTDTGYLVYGANGIIGRYTEYNHEQPVIAITCRGATCGNVLITEPKSYITSNAMVLDEVDEEQIHLKFLLYALRKRGFNDVISGSAQPQITRTNLAKIQIPLPPLPEQIHIANVLSKAEALIAKRKESLALLDAYLKSTFLEMFGDPVRNEKGWEVKRLGDVTNLITDGKHGDSANEENSGFYFISAKDIHDGIIDYSKARQITESDFREVHRRTNLKPGDLVMVNTGATIGKMAIAKNDPRTLATTFQKSVAVVKFNFELVSAIYVKFLFSLRLKDLVKSSSGSAQQNLLLSEMRKINVITPPLELQNQFAVVVEKVEALKETYQESLRELEALYGALSQRAFRGELGGGGKKRIKAET